MEIRINTDQLSMNPEHKQSLSDQDRNLHRHKAAGPRESMFVQSRCISASHVFRWPLPVYCGRLYPLCPYGKASLAWHEDSIRYLAGFHDRSAEQTPCIKADRNM